ncbi:serine/threonine-protein kinase [candidate division KSB1 bacterium]|nr:serine/threonine-protein kinase [candidate division KSB1 bacterium]
MIGQIISHYKILEKLGAGGMGVVYKAQDLKLDRFVALKFLPPDLSVNEEEKQRFIHEAKAASALDHPNICNIHEIDETKDGQIFICMAHYEGETLQKKVSSNQLSVNSVIDIAIKIAQGLAAVHAHGIVHRDIKPANIIVTNDGAVKIVDFGIAKLAGATRIPTTGTTIGTPMYISPEQARGETVDHRTDIWSLGVVLYEMLTGRPPFKEEVEQALLYSILHEKPKPLSKYRAGVPERLQPIVDKALDKNPEARYQHIEELLADLRQESERQSQAFPFLGKLPMPKLTFRIAAVVLGLMVLIVGILSYIQLRRDITILRLTKPAQVTSAIGVEDFPTWSPEGGRLAYQANESGNWDIWVAQLGKGQPVNLTENHPSPYLFPSWSPDGSQIAFWSDRDGGGLFIMPALGGVPRKVLATQSIEGQLTQPQWSMEGTEIAYLSTTSSGHFIELYSLRTGKSRQIQLRAGKEAILGIPYELRWSPNGRYFAFVDAVSNLAVVTRIWILRLTDEKLIPVTEARTNDWSPTWSKDGRLLYFVSNRGGSMDIWQQQIKNDGSLDGSPLPVTTGIGIRRAAFSADGWMFM